MVGFRQDRACQSRSLTFAETATAGELWSPLGIGPMGDAEVYQLAFFTPGIRPRLARFRKQMRQMPNLR